MKEHKPEEVLKIAAKMLGGQDASIANLDATLIAALGRLDNLCRKAGGHLKSRQAIAIVIWHLEQFPGVPLYHTGG